MAKTILVVEDERNIVDILTFNLRREGYDTLEALDGAAGLRLALEKDPDLILLDLMLPKMDGFQVCRTLREQGRATPIIMLTAREEETDKVLGLELGADDYITKPFSMRELLARVKSNIRRSEMLSQAAPKNCAAGIPSGTSRRISGGRSGSRRLTVGLPWIPLRSIVSTGRGSFQTPVGAGATAKLLPASPAGVSASSRLAPKPSISSRQRTAYRSGRRVYTRRRAHCRASSPAHQEKSPSSSTSATVALRPSSPIIRSSCTPAMAAIRPANTPGW